MARAYQYHQAFTLALASSLVAALNSKGCYTSGQNRPIAEGQAIANATCSALIGQNVPVGHPPHEGKKLHACSNYPPNAPSYHWDLDITTICAVQTPFGAGLVPDCIAAINNIMNKCSNDGGLNTHGGKIASSSFSCLQYDWDPGFEKGSGDGVLYVVINDCKDTTIEEESRAKRASWYYPIRARTRNGVSNLKGTSKNESGGILQCSRNREELEGSLIAVSRFQVW
ncbi:hypothetical protein L218DRAFT_950103 [Marasmius fiardii PR-910]|nr:hypothetical protein L218DRAFT_950103 [Marasmius fiardii PR-910]